MSFGMPQRIDNQKGQKIATKTEWDSSIELKDSSGRLLAKYNKQNGYTYNGNNVQIGRGNIIDRFIPA